MTNYAGVGLSLGPLLPFHELLSLATFADGIKGVRSLWIPESWGRESFATLGALSCVTKRVLLGTSILNVYSRSAATIAMGAATIENLSGNRMVVGLGSSTEAIVTNWHSQRFRRPLQRVREYAESIRLIISGEKADYEGEIVTTRGFSLLTPPTSKSVPIFIAAINNKMISVAAEVGDGILLYLRPLEELKTSVEMIKNLVGQRRSFEIALSVICAVSDLDPQKAKERAAMTLGFYIAVGKYYSKFLSEHGFDTEVKDIISAYRQGGVKSAAKAVPERMTESLTISGTSDECLRSLQRFKGNGVTLPILQVNPVEGDESSFREFISLI